MTSSRQSAIERANRISRSMDNEAKEDSNEPHYANLHFEPPSAQPSSINKQKISSADGFKSSKKSKKPGSFKSGKKIGKKSLKKTCAKFKENCESHKASSEYTCSPSQNYPGVKRRDVPPLQIVPASSAGVVSINTFIRKETDQKGVASSDGPPLVSAIEDKTQTQQI
uniref:Uncharacterized protein n=1 Tax=Ditylenchus dipsaci TaxID=166011 RepID=A0A915CWV7_9BILA